VIINLLSAYTGMYVQTETAELVGPAWQAQHPALRDRAEIVLKRYDDLLKRASRDE